MHNATPKQILIGIKLVYHFKLMSFHEPDHLTWLYIMPKIIEFPEHTKSCDDSASYVVKGAIIDQNRCISCSEKLILACCFILSFIHCNSVREMEYNTSLFENYV